MAAFYFIIRKDKHMNKRKRRTVIAGNWKMNMTPDEATAMIKELRPMIKGRRGCDVVLCVPAIDIPAAIAAAKGSRIKIGAENVHFEEKGAFTGEISAKMLLACGVEYVIIGHSERRQYFGETDATVNKRVLAALNAGLEGHTLRRRSIRAERSRHNGGSSCNADEDRTPGRYGGTA